MSRESKQDELLDHQYDGIQEYDNPLPRWWVWIFYATIIYAVLYFVNVPGIGIGRGRIANYERDIVEAHQRYAAAHPAGPVMSEAALLAMTHDAGRQAAGRQVFESNCSPCHRPDGGGNIGPNLTDEYWLHGGHPLEVLKTITEGVPAKGMPAWGQILKPEQIPTVAAYVLTLRGTHPASPKPPQGEKEEDAGASR